MDARAFATIVGRAGAVYFGWHALSTLFRIIGMWQTDQAGDFHLSRMLAPEIVLIAAEFGLAAFLWFAPQRLAPKAPLPDDGAPVGGDILPTVIRAVCLGLLIVSLSGVVSGLIALSEVAWQVNEGRSMDQAVTVLVISGLEAAMAGLAVVYAPEIATWRIKR